MSRSFHFATCLGSHSVHRFAAIARALATAMLFNLLPHPTSAAVVNLETAGRRLDLQAPPSFSASIRGEQFVVGFVKDGGTNVSLIDAELSTVSESMRLDFPIAGGTVDFSGTRLFAIGNRDGKTRIATVDLAPEGKVRERTLPMMLADPLVAVDAADTVRVADKGTGRIFVLDRKLFDDPALPAMVVETFYYDGPRGIGSMFASADGQFIFIGDPASRRISVIDASGRVRDTLSGLSELPTSDLTTPSAISFHDGSQGVSAGVSMLIADYASQTLRVVDFEPVLQAFSVTATTSIALATKPGPRTRTAAVDGIAENPAVLGASSDQKTIVVSDLHSTTALFFSRSGAVLERIGSAALSRPTSRLLVSNTGRTILVLYQGQPFLTVTKLVVSGDDRQPGGMKLDPGGVRQVREIQRLLNDLGYPIGAIDGFAGPRTMQSLEALKGTTDSRLDITNPESTVKTLRSLRRRP